jgi:hypothetical protein
MVRCAMWLCLLTMVCGYSGSAQTPSNPPENFRMVGVEKLHLARLPGAALPAYYSAGYEQRARALQGYIEGEQAFYRKQLGVGVGELVLAVLNPTDWPELSAGIPYGVPSVAGRPPVIVMPASWTEAKSMPLPDVSALTPATRAKVASSGRSVSEWVHDGEDGIGAHELGHVLVKNLGIEAPSLWLNELLASYVADAYVEDARPQDRLGEHVFTEISLRRPHPHTSLDYFDAHYKAIMSKTPSNYGWYQEQFNKRVLAVYAKEGLRFLRKMQAAFPEGGPELTNAEVLDKLETIEPGWKEWASELEADRVRE